MKVNSYIVKGACLLMTLHITGASAQLSNAITTGNQSDTYYRIGEDLRQYAMPEPAFFKLVVTIDRFKRPFFPLL